MADDLVSQLEDRYTELRMPCCWHSWLASLQPLQARAASIVLASDVQMEQRLEDALGHTVDHRILGAGCKCVQANGHRKRHQMQQCIKQVTMLHPERPAELGLPDEVAELPDEVAELLAHEGTCDSFSLDAEAVTAVRSASYLSNWKTRHLRFLTPEIW